MVDNEKQFEDFVRQIKFDDTADPAHRDKLEQDLLAALAKQPRQIEIWRTIMKTKITKLATAAAIILIVALGIILFNKSTAPAWAIEQTIKAVEKFNAVHISGTFSGDFTSSGVFRPDNVSQHGFNLWARANEGHTQSSDFRLQIDNGQNTWVQENDTYHYYPSSHKLHIIRGEKASISPWIGPDLLQTLEQVTDDWQVLYATDPATGRERAIVTCSHKDAPGPKSWRFEFDLETKLPVSFKQWHNLYWQGKPNFDAQKIIYYENLPDEVFEFEIPKNVEITETEVFIPSWALAILNDLNYGISVEGLTRQDACREILEQFWGAIVNDDLARIRQLLPVTADWDDETLICNLGLNEEDDVVELLEIGQPCEETTSDLGPVVVVPSIIKCKDGKTREIKIIIQFRHINGQSSCVIYANSGSAREID
jgi:hypothetical protein